MANCDDISRWIELIVIILFAWAFNTSVFLGVSYGFMSMNFYAGLIISCHGFQLYCLLFYHQIVESRLYWAWKLLLFRKIYNIIYQYHGVSRFPVDLE